ARPTGVEGMVRYNTDDHALEVYQGSTPSWVQLAINTTTAGSSTYLGGSATLTSPSRSDDVTTGLFSDAAGQVQVSITGTERLRVTATGMHVVGNINLAALTNYIAVMGTKVLHQPASDTTSIGVGPNALAAQTATKLNNTAVGVSAMAATTTGNSNAALGLDAMKKNTSGSNNTAVGFSALYSAIAGNDNTAIGYEAMYSTTTGSNNTAVGFRALRANTTGLFNTAIGNAAIYQITSGSNNTAIGYAVGLGILTGSNNILIGTSSAVDTPEADTSNWLNIGNTIYGNLNTGSVALGGSATGVTAGTTLDLSNRTDSLLLTKGNNTTDRPTGVEGMIRYNTTDRTVEVYQGSTPAWVALSAGATGGSTMYLGGSATLTSPSRSDDVTTGLYSDAASTVKVSIGGTQKLAVTATGVNLTSATNGYAINNVNMLHHVGADATSVGIGPGSLQTMTGTGSYNYAFGYQALQTNTASGMAAGTYNNALGYHALQSNSATGTYTGGYNNAIGYVALSQNKGNGDGAGSYNNAMGYYALFSNTATDTAAGSSNNAIGNYALYANRANGDGAGSYNNSYGYHALYSNTANGSSAGTYNNAIGIRAIYTNVATGFLAGSYNNAVGARALYSNTASGEEAGSYNNAIGVWTLYSNSGIGDGAGSYNNAYGYHALYLNTGSGNTAIGSYALGNESATITGSRNVALGWGVGQTGLTSGSDNILIGTSSAVTTPTTSTSNWLNIGNTIYGNLSTGSVALGGSATGVTAGTTLDLSNRTDSLLLTKGNNTTDRPTGVEGMIRYNTTDHALEVYQGSTPGWVALGVTASGTVATTLGPAVGAPSPYRDGEATTGLYSDAAGQVQVGIAGTERLRVTATGLHVVGNINLASITNYLSISGTKILHQPASDSLSIGIGPGALAAQTATDAGNTAVGYYSMYGNTTGYANTAVGREALRANTEGVLNTAIGREALYATTSGQYNTAVGSSALRSNTTASNNTAVGSYALYTNTTGFQNSALGQQALYKNTIGSYNVALGYYALYNNTTAMANTAIGFQALGTTTTGGYNTAIGYNVMGSTVGTYNTALGTNAGAALTTGAYNTMIGNGVGFAGLTTGSRNILIGTSSAVTTPAVGTNDWLNIGNTIYGNLATGSIALGGSATGVTAGTTLDLSNRKDSLLLTKGNNTTDRPVGVEGMIRYNTTDHALEVYQGSTPGWVALGVTASGTVASTLGPAVGAPSPYRDGEATTGLYSSAAGQVQVGIAGTERLRVTATSVLADGLLFSDTMVLGGTSLTTGSTFDMSNVTNSMILPKGATAARPTGVEGMVRYNTDDHALEVYQGSTPSWVQLAVNTTTAGSTMYLGGSATLTSPSRSDDVTTGLYSSAAGQVQTSIAGTERLRVTATGMHMVGNINLAALTNYISITGTKVLWQPASDTTSIGVGPNALAAQTATNRNNTAVGVSAQAAMTTGVQNTAMGKSALAAVSTGSYNTAFGYNALSTTALGTYNTAIGTNAGVALTTGTYNTMLGNGVGHTGLTTGSRNILIGTSSAVTTPAVGTNDWLNIGNTIYGDLSTGRVALGAAAVTAGAIFDLSGATGTAKSSMILPKDTTTNRPTAGVEGMIRYNTTDRIVEVYQGSTPTWVQLDAAGTGTASSTLGASTATPSPYRSGEATTGLYSSAAGQVQTAIAGTERLRVTATGLHVVGNINLAAITNYYSIAGTKILHQPASDTTSIGVGPDTLFSQSATDLANVAVGYQAQPQTVGGYGNNAVGFQALYSNTSGYLNDALGYQALFSNQTGFSNVAVGKDALYSNVDGARNTAVGLAALRSTTGNSNTGLGFRAGRAITSGEGNVAIGYEVGYTTLATGSNNILIGTSSAVDTPAADTSNFLNIGNVINANISSQLVGINRGTTLAIHPFQVGTSSSNGNGAYLTSAGVWTSISDARVKENVKPLAYGIDDLMKLRPVSYDMKGTHEKQIGLIAQEVMKVVPEVVSGSEETRYGLSYDTLLALAIKSIQELKVANDNQAKTVAQLSEENVQLRAKIQDLHDHASGAKVTMDDHDLIMMVIKVGGALFVLMLTGVGLCGYGLWRAVRRKAA
ncbi:MAG: hypothetical protein EOM37_08410, partial [Proteobacteria bacterium]|nr:hypothetical protein [Pseudomonadota bacterium]